MKKICSLFLALCITFSLPAAVWAAETDSGPIPPQTLLVNEEPLDLAGLPLPLYYEEGSLMVPLRKVGEALGYMVSWDPQTGAITVDDEYIQRATLYGQKTTVLFEGHLQIIDLSREAELPAAVAVHDGHTYVPMEFFREFFNDTLLEETVLKISPSKSELCG